jgi:hypothetical protein
VLRMLAQALLPYLRAELIQRAAPPHERWMTADETPCPRLTKEACRRGRIDGARKLHRRWMFTAEAWDRYVQAFGKPPASDDALPSDRAGDDEDDVEAALAEMRAQFGFVDTGRRAS